MKPSGRLDSEQRKDVRRAVGAARSTALIADLETLIAGFVGARQEALRFRYRSASPSDTEKAARRVGRAAQGLQQALEAAPQMLQERLRLGTRALTAKTSVGWVPDMFDGALLDLTATAKTLADENASEVKAKKEKRGSKADILRQALELGVGRVLAQHGVGVSTGDTGAFARVLAVVYAAATGNRMPENPRRRLRPVASKLRRR